MSVRIDQLSAEHHHDGFAISSPSPRLSWRFGSTTIRGWQQASYELRITRNHADELYQVDSPDSLLVPWPAAPLSSRETAHVAVRATGSDGSHTNWAGLDLEAALLDRDDWVAQLISGPAQDSHSPKKPLRLRKTFRYYGGRGRLYITAHGIYQIEINGRIVGDQVLAPAGNPTNIVCIIKSTTSPIICHREKT